MKEFCGRLAENELFERLIIFLIVLNALSMGAETFPELSSEYDAFFDFVFLISQAIFTFEIAIRILAHTPHFRNFFRGFWNWFDFLIVVASFLPAIGTFALVARILRVLRTLRIVSVSDHLRDYVNRMHSTLDVIAFSGLIWLVLVYIFSVCGYYLFSDIDAEHWGSLWRCVKTVGYLSLLQNVPGIAEQIVNQTITGALYLLVFYGTFVTLVLNTLAGVFHDYMEPKKLDSKGADND